jgi:hypothetical protein
MEGLGEGKVVRTRALCHMNHVAFSVDFASEYIGSILQQLLIRLATTFPSRNNALCKHLSLLACLRLTALVSPWPSGHDRTARDGIESCIQRVSYRMCSVFGSVEITHFLHLDVHPRSLRVSWSLNLPLIPRAQRGQIVMPTRCRPLGGVSSQRIAASCARLVIHPS